MYASRKICIYIKNRRSEEALDYTGLQVDYGLQPFSRLNYENHYSLLYALKELPQLKVLITRGFNPSGPQLDSLALAIPGLLELRLSREFSLHASNAPAFQRFVTQLKVGAR